MKNKKQFLTLAATLVLSALVAVPTLANEDGNGVRMEGRTGLRLGTDKPLIKDVKREIKDEIRDMRPVVIGKVTAISGSTITLASRTPGKDSATTTYTVNASAAVVLNGTATSSLSSITVGDNILVLGAVSGTSVTATKIIEAPVQRKDGSATSTRPMGNGQPVVAGKVTAISGSTLTVTTGNGAAYSVDTANAKFLVKGNASATISSVAVGDAVVVQGTVNGSSVTASTVFDQKAPNDKANDGNRGGFFGRIGGFFKNLFGF